MRTTKITLAALAFAGLAAGGALAQQAAGDPIALRQGHFKELAAAVREPGGMLKGQAPFDLEKVQGSLRVISANAVKNLELFPDATRTSTVKNEALPAIWERKAEFNALFNKMDTDAKGALERIKDEASFKAEFPKVLANCGACHNNFRVKSS